MKFVFTYNGKRYMLNVTRFLFFVLVCICLFTVVGLAMEEPKSSEEVIQEALEKFEKVEVVVKQGDTAWTLQENLTPEEDVRYMLYLVEILNGKCLGDIMPGEKLIFLKNK